MIIPTIPLLRRVLLFLPGLLCTIDSLTVSAAAAAAMSSSSSKITPTTTITSSSSSSRRLFSLSGQRVLITGAGRGIGQAMARICYAQGAKVAICARTATQLQETVRSLRRQQQRSTRAETECDDDDDDDDSILSFVTDVRDATQVRAMMESIGKAWNGGLDILVNNAGRGQAKKGPVTDLDAAELMELLQLNVVAVHTVTAAAVPYLQNAAATKTTTTAMTPVL